ncbi:neurofilament heavy polypeptide-like [Macrobrachium nipponense]|uniref:neurofilament heavy polypeptide-like n=1 Tax=Macrobrachium nipponense TaxID=159736 RepID=UPI0030C7BC94
MKWVLLLSLAVSLATGRTIFDYERDGLENKQKGLPGRSVTGQYEWRGPDGKVTEVSYIADHNGFRLLDDLELKPPTEPFRQAESTAQANTRYSSAFSNSEQEEEEEGEEEEEENETEEGETEEEEHEEEGGEEASEAQEVERKAEQEETEQEETDAAASEAEKAESPKANEKEADATEKENENQDSENTGKDLEQSDATEKQLTTNDADTKEQAFPEPSIASEPVAEEKLGEAEAATSSATVLTPSKVESTSPEETSAMLEPAFVDKTLSTVVAEPVFPAEAPVIITGELATAQPIVGPVAAELSAFASSGAQGPAEQSPNVAEIIPEAFAFSDTSLLAVDEIHSDSSTNSQPLIVSRDNDNSPSAFSEPAVIIIGSFSDESDDTILSSNIQNSFERDERTVANNMQVQEQVSEPFVHPVLELDSFNTEVFPVAEPLQQPAIELEPVPIDVGLSPDSEPLQRPVVEVEAVSTDNAIPILPVFEVPEVSVAKMLDVQPQETQLVPVIELEVPQQTAEAIQATPFEELPLALPLQQVQILETANLPTPNARPVETSPSADPNTAVFVREIELSETDTKPTLEIELTKHRFDVAKSSHPEDSTTFLADTPAHNAPKDLFFIPETFQVPDANPSQVVKAKMFSKLGEPMNSEFIRVTANELEKPTTILSGQTSDPFNIFPVQSPSVVGVNSEQFQSDFVFVPEQMLVREPEITDGFILPLETPVSAPQVQEPLPNQATQQLVLTPAGESSAASLQVDNISVPVIELPVDAETEDPEGILFIRATEPLVTENAQLKNRSPMQGLPLLPPMMKVPRLLL